MLTSSEKRNILEQFSDDLFSSAEYHFICKTSVERFNLFHDYDFQDMLEDEFGFKFLTTLLNREISKKNPIPYKGQTLYISQSDDKKTYYYIDIYGAKVTHRNDGPAERLRNKKIWMQHGKIHRDDGPAIVVFDLESSTFRKEWYRNGLIHREDGPAVIYANGSAKFYYKNVYYNFEDWICLPLDITEERKAELILQYH